MPGGNVFFIGDLHLGHDGIHRRFRPQYPTLHDHDLGLVENWNAVVRSKHDLVWVLGDACLNITRMPLFDQMTGRKILVAGNHDRFDTQVYLKYFERVIACEVRYGFVLTHIPIHPNELRYRRWAINVHGHVHNHEKAPEGNQYINVNADVRDLTPVSLDTIRKETSAHEHQLTLDLLTHG